MAILEKYNYNFKILSAQKINMHLKTVAAKAGVDINLTFHVGRHTFATWALSVGVPIEQVSKMLAHADITTTQIYAKVLQKDVDRGFDILRNNC
ncbi:MAG: tyrosine-type recombinase/integrase [Bacteroidaceae bacterium]|nr:tyrosine-type recombinase/integrase [Bacteroidaceae bacterium]